MHAAAAAAAWAAAAVAKQIWSVTYPSKWLYLKGVKDMYVCLLARDQTRSESDEGKATGVQHTTNYIIPQYSPRCLLPSFLSLK